MMNSKLKKGLQRGLLALLAAVMLVGVALSLPARATGYAASHIEKLEGLKTDYMDYVNGDVLYQLPSTVSDEQQISVIVTLDILPLLDAYEQTDKTMSFTEYALYSEEAQEIRACVGAEKAEFLSELDELEIAYVTGEDYATLLSGFELVIRAGDFADTCKALGKGRGIIVGEVYNTAETELVENTVNVYETGIFNSSDVVYDGSGMVVAVLDTGLDSAHSAFSVENFTSDKLGLTYEEVEALVSQTRASELMEGLTVDDVYINEKVPFGFDYADNDPDVYSTHNNHGTHVSGVITGKDDTITGVAPNAQLVSMKIFSDVEDSARSAWILAALEDCVILGVDVINMSLGTACGFSRESDEEILNGVYDKIRAAGISMVVAASNSYSSAYGSEANGNLGLTSNPDTGTVGSPSTYKGALSVASINGVETPYLLYKDTIIYFDESNTAAGEENDFCGTLLGDRDSVEIEYVIIPGVGRSADYTGLDVTGKVVLVRRGDTTFEEKAIIAQAKGAAGIIIYNNVSGDIKMNVGDATLATCSISQDDGEMLVAAGGGTLTISKDQTSGPFISDFSSWGPTPDLKIKPEITGHGGNILSSVTGGGYDRLSGTSMACPNLSGVVILLRQYVEENFPEIADDNTKVAAMVNCLMMSTADIIYNTNGLPYSVRKQGAGLANLVSSVTTPAYITTYDEDGEAMDKTKLELGDDPDKIGIYELNFTVTNFGDKDLTYNVGGYVFTEGVSDTKTNAGETTVTEEAYILEGASVVVTTKDSNGGHLKDGKLTVQAGESMDVTVTISLSDEDKAYLDISFENGMYVEGFITLTAEKGTEVDLSVPYLAFYGDWTEAPLFDLTYYETNADELDNSIAVEDKLMADAYATRLIGGIEEDYVSYLGSYYFIQDPNDMVISASKDYIALSNQEGTVHSLRFMWTGMLRSAERIEITITDDSTGEVIYECLDTDVRKSYGDGGSIYPANVEIEFDTMEYNLANNTKYTIRVEGYLDYRDGGVETNDCNVYEFPLTIDIEAPTLTDVEFYYEYDKTLSKNRLYAKAAVYDNHYTMASQLGYVLMGEDENGEATPEMVAFEQYLTPVYSQENSTTYVTFELTDYIYDIKENSMNENSFVVTVYDYALNYATYEIGLPDNYVDFYFEGLEDGLTLSPNEVYSLEPMVVPNTEWSELLEFSSSRPSVVRVVNNKLVAVSTGIASIKVRDPGTNKSMIFSVTVLGEDDEGYRRYDKPVADIFRLTGYQTAKAYFMVNSSDKDIGDTGDVRFFEGVYDLSMYPSEAVRLTYDLDAYFPNETSVVFETSNDSIVTVDNNGVITAKAEGYASVTIKVLQNDRSTYYSETVSIEVKDPFVTSGATLTNYYGNGGLVTIPGDLGITIIGNFAFSNYEYVAKDPSEIYEGDIDTTKMWFIGDSTITKVIIPEGVETISAYAFANLTALEEVVLPSTLEAIEYGAFYNCSSLEKITFSGVNNLKIINQNAFENCNIKGTLDLSSVCMISDYAFAGNKNLEGVVTSDSLLSIGQYAFAGCKALSEVTITAEKVKYGAYAFTGCEALASFYVNASVLPEGMFYQCDGLTSVTIGPDVNAIGEFAFRETAITSFEISAGNQAYKVQSSDYILSADGKQLVAVAPTIAGEFSAENIGGAVVTSLARGAFSHNTKITSVTLEDVTKVYEYAFGSCERLTSVALGHLCHIGEYAFFETAITELPHFDADTVIERYAFAFTDVTDVIIPDNMTVAEGVFSQCLQLASVTIGDNVTLESYAFYIDKDNSFTVAHYDEGGDRYFYYEFASALTSLTIGKNAAIGDNAFSGAASLETISLGEGAEIGYMAFYNNCSLKNIDLSTAIIIDDYAFSGDVYYVCLDDSMVYAAVNSDGHYIYTYHGAQIEYANLAAAQSVGAHAFSYCRNLREVVLGDAVTEIAEYTFAGCAALTTVDMSKVTSVGSYAFAESGLTAANLSSVESIGEYAFVYCYDLSDVKFNTNGVTMDEGAFAYCESLATVENMHCATEIGAYAFAYTSIVEADLSGAVSIDDMAFLKEELTPFTVVLGEGLTYLGDNPFAMCQLKPFCKIVVETINGTDYETTLYTYDLSNSVFIIDGSLYCAVPSGMELITYAGINNADAKVADETVRIAAYAFAGSNVESVTLPYTVEAVGHKAFYACENLTTVVFSSYYAPILEEEFDAFYYESYEHIPGTGDFGTYTDYDGTEVSIIGNGLIPYFMWNATGSMYSNVFYGANFVDYVGYVYDKLTMIRPVNGQNYDSYILAQYFDQSIDGAAAADDVTLAAIAAIKAIPERVSYEEKGIVEAARAAYDKIATTLQQALVTNYADLVSAEQRILALSTPNEEPSEDPVEEPESNSWVWIVVVCVVVVVAIAAAVVLVLKKRSSLSVAEEEEVDVEPEVGLDVEPQPETDETTVNQ